jgi:hypothetical protein
MLQTARGSSVPETQERNIASARKAHDEIKVLAGRIEMFEVDRQGLNGRLADLASELDQFTRQRLVEK